MGANAPTCQIKHYIIMLYMQSGVTYTPCAADLTPSVDIENVSAQIAAAGECEGEAGACLCHTIGTSAVSHDRAKTAHLSSP